MSNLFEFYEYLKKKNLNLQKKKKKIITKIHTGGAASDINTATLQADLAYIERITDQINKNIKKQELLGTNDVKDILNDITEKLIQQGTRIANKPPDDKQLELRSLLETIKLNIQNNDSVFTLNTNVSQAALPMPVKPDLRWGQLLRDIDKKMDAIASDILNLNKQNISDINKQIAAVAEIIDDINSVQENQTGYINSINDHVELIRKYYTDYSSFLVYSVPVSPGLCNLFRSTYLGIFAPFA
jgi:hypothetical protein